ncbi:uncharacterized protein LOC107782523 [Nicotiana tabacum]|uniref:Uncharacterized protein LOC107782523 n=1 Tax=Nicotiana tabacum TaxID=4097 RepID=A0AC58RPI5_TOBAC
MVKISKTVPHKEKAFSSWFVGDGTAAEPHPEEFIPRGCPIGLPKDVSMRPPSSDEDLTLESPTPKQGDEKKRKRGPSSPNSEKKKPKKWSHKPKGSIGALSTDSIHQIRDNLKKKKKKKKKRNLRYDCKSLYETGTHISWVGLTAFGGSKFSSGESKLRAAEQPEFAAVKIMFAIKKRIRDSSLKFWSFNFILSNINVVSRETVPNCAYLPKATSFMRFFSHVNSLMSRNYHQMRLSYQDPAMNALILPGSLNFWSRETVLKWFHARRFSSPSIELNTEKGVVRFRFGQEIGKSGGQTKAKHVVKKFKMSKKAKLNELRLYRLKAKKKMRSPNPEIRIRYKLEKAKRKEAWLIEKLRKFEVPKAPDEPHDPEILTEEEKFYLKRTGEKKKNYVPVGRRGVFGGVVLNMHLHWKKHETVKVVCKPCKPGQVHEYAAELTRLSRGIVIDIKPDNTIIFYRGKNYVQPEVMSPPNTLSKDKALEKYRYEQSLEHTSQFIEKMEKELEEYHEYLARKRKEEKS